MFPEEFDYYRAGSIDEAISLLGEHSDGDTEILAGGHSLLPTMKSGLSSPDTVIDISRVNEMSGISVGSDTITIGATTNYAEVADSDEVWESATCLAEAVSAIGDKQVRNRGTVGGNIAHADPASDLTGAFLASNGTVVVQGPDGERRIGAEDFFLGMYATAVEPDEIVTKIEVPMDGEDTVGAYVKKPSPASGYPIIGVAAVVETDGDTIQSARIAVNNLMDHAVRLTPAEDALAGEPATEESVAAAAEVATDDLDEMMMMQDIEASPEFRAQLAHVFTERALNAALDRVESPTPAAAD